MLFRGEDLLKMPESKRPDLPGAQRIAYHLPGRAPALNPLYSVGIQIGELFTGASRDVDARRRRRASR